jgi:hypothetical protein
VEWALVVGPSLFKDAQRRVVGFLNFKADVGFDYDIGLEVILN